MKHHLVAFLVGAKLGARTRDYRWCRFTKIVSPVTLYRLTTSLGRSMALASPDRSGATVLLITAGLCGSTAKRSQHDDSCKFGARPFRFGLRQEVPWF
jgi:hypothetical protein